MSDFDLIVVPRGWRTKLIAVIKQLAPSDWPNKLRVHELTQQDMPRAPTSVEVCDVAHTTRATRVFLCKGIAFDGATLLKDRVSYQILDSFISEFAQRKSRELRRFLAQRGLDNEARAHAAVGLWMHSDADDELGRPGSWVGPTIDTWRRQFDRVNTEDGFAVADALLRSLDVMATGKVAACVKRYGVHNRYGFIKDVFGKSWGVVLNALAKAPHAAAQESVLALHEAITSAKNLGFPLRVVEDGLFSATELLGVVDSLMGLRSDGDASRKRKTDALDDPTDMYAAAQEWAYGCVTDYGEYMFAALARSWGFNNLTLQLSAGTKRMKVLKRDCSPTLETALAQIQQLPWSPNCNNTDRSESLRRFRAVLNRYVVPHFASVFDRNGDGMLTEPATRLCSQIGEQLWRAYLQHAFGTIDPIRWSVERIQQCALGKDGLGLTFAFSHSVPKASLPVLWASGAVQAEDGELFDWRPLFPNAA